MISVQFWKKNNVPKPYNVFTSILSAKGKKAVIDEFGRFSRPLSRNIIKSMTAYINEDSSFAEAIYPLLTSLAHLFGLEKSRMYNSDSSHKKEKFDFMKNK